MTYADATDIGDAAAGTSQACGQALYSCAAFYSADQIATMTGGCCTPSNTKYVRQDPIGTISPLDPYSMYHREDGKKDRYNALQFMTIMSSCLAPLLSSLTRTFGGRRYFSNMYVSHVMLSSNDTTNTTLQLIQHYKNHHSMRQHGRSPLILVIRQAKDPPHLHIPFSLERSRARHILVTYLFISMSMSMAVSTTLAFQTFYSSKDRPLHIT